MDGRLPTTTIEWIFIVAIAGIMLGGSALILINEIQQVLATHEYILADVPMKVDQIDKNIVKICTLLNADCIT